MKKKRVLSRKHRLERPDLVAKNALAWSEMGFDAEPAVHPSGNDLGSIGMRGPVVYVGGTIHIESRPGNGTTFVVRIPGGSPWKHESFRVRSGRRCSIP
jgi:hypothetical protein